MEILDIIRLVAPEFDQIDDSDMEKWISLARPYVSKKKFAEFYEQAIAYLVCHMLTTAGLGDVSGYGELGALANLASSSYGIGSISAGASSISFTNNGAQSNFDPDVEFMRTKYGVQYVTLRKLCIVPITIA